MKGYTVVPVRMYLKNGRAKLEIALAKGKNLYDKRQSDKIRDAKREMETCYSMHVSFMGLSWFRQVYV